jgi:hypothetical protein
MWLPITKTFGTVITFLEHHPYCLDVSFSDFSLFPNMKEAHEGKWFQQRENIQHSAGLSLANMKKNQSAGDIHHLPRM